MKIPKRNKQGIKASYRLYKSTYGYWCVMDINSKKWFAVNLKTKDFEEAKTLLDKSEVFWLEDSRIKE